MQCDIRDRTGADILHATGVLGARLVFGDRLGLGWGFLGYRCRMSLR